MAKFVLKDAYVSVNGVTLSTRVKSVTFPFGAEALEANAMGDNTKIKLPGLKEWSVDVEFYQDFAAANVDATLFNLVGADPFTIAVRAVASLAKSATNPEFTGSVILSSYTPIGGSAGEMAKAPAKFECAGDLTRSVA